MRTSQTQLPANIDGASGSEKFTQMRQEHYRELFNCVKSNPSVADNIDNNEDMIVSPQEVHDAVKSLKDSKAWIIFLQNT